MLTKGTVTFLRAWLMIWQLVEKKTLSLVYFPDRKVIAIASSERKYDLIKNLRVIQIWQTYYCYHIICMHFLLKCKNLISVLRW